MNRRGATFTEPTARELLRMFNYLKRNGFAIDRGRDRDYRQPIRGTGLFVFQTTSSFSAGIASADITRLSGASYETGSSVKDPVGHFADVISGSKGICVKEGGTYYALTPYVADLRVNGFTLQLNKHNDTSTWDTWHTGDECDV